LIKVSFRLSASTASQRPSIRRPVRAIYELVHSNWLLLLVLLAIPLLFWQLTFTNLIFARGDTYYYFYPYWEYRAFMLRQWQLPLWNPYLFMGAPFLANSQAGVLYPLNWLLIGLSTPQAVKASILLHLGIGAVGMYGLARRGLRFSMGGAAIAALLFSLSGYLTAKVEQVNQLQGLVWLPYLLWTVQGLCQASDGQAGRWRAQLQAGAALALVLGLQILAGHTQSTFISLVGCVVWAGLQALANPLRWQWRQWLPYLHPAPFLLLGVLIAAAQLLPTFELTRHSFRSTGMTPAEAVSFSLNPLFAGRALLPSYGRSLFTEYLAYIGLGGLFLAGAGLLGSWRDSRRVQLVGLAGVALFFAIGKYNPFYWVLVKVIPGFNLFRVPARWLVLWVVGVSLLAGWGAERVLLLTTRQRRVLLGAWSGILLLGIGLYVVSSTFVPAGELGPPGAPLRVDWLGWGLAALLVLLLVAGMPKFGRWSVVGLALLTFGELWFAAAVLPLNRLTTPDAYHNIRPAMTQLLVAARAAEPSQAAGRFLSLSNLQFSPGDLSELNRLWEKQLPPDPLFDAVVATKAKEVLSPNLPLAWRVPSVDGYDGGVLPLRAYAEFAKQFTNNELSTDGRLREYITSTPPNWLLNQSNTRWLITDKTADIWLDNIFYDMQFSETLARDAITNLAGLQQLPPFESSALSMVIDLPIEANLSPTTEIGWVQVHGSQGELFRVAIPAQLAQVGHGTVEFPQTVIPTAIEVGSDHNGLVLRGVTLRDVRTQAFQPLTVGPYRMAYSGDVKIYENLNVPARAFWVDKLPLTAQTPLHNTGISIVDYQPEQVTLQVELPQAGVLVLADVIYPGWQAWVDGQPAAIVAAAQALRAVTLTAGSHTVIFRYQPRSWQIGWMLSLAALGTVGLIVFVSVAWRRKTIA
jgi:hypothetical protein